MPDETPRRTRISLADPIIDLEALLGLNNVPGRLEEEERLNAQASQAPRSQPSLLELSRATATGTPAPGATGEGAQLTLEDIGLPTFPVASSATADPKLVRAIENASSARVQASQEAAVQARQQAQQFIIGALAESLGPNVLQAISGVNVDGPRPFQDSVLPAVQNVGVAEGAARREELVGGAETEVVLAQADAAARQADLANRRAVYTANVQAQQLLYGRQKDAEDADVRAAERAVRLRTAERLNNIHAEHGEFGDVAVSLWQDDPEYYHAFKNAGGGQKGIQAAAAYKRRANRPYYRGTGNPTTPVGKLDPLAQTYRRRLEGVQSEIQEIESRLSPVEVEEENGKYVVRVPGQEDQVFDTALEAQSVVNVAASSAGNDEARTQDRARLKQLRTEELDLFETVMDYGGAGKFSPDVVAGFEDLFPAPEEVVIDDLAEEAPNPLDLDLF